jgi:hypothetical protein
MPLQVMAGQRAFSPSSSKQASKSPDVSPATIATWGADGMDAGPPASFRVGRGGGAIDIGA